MLFAKAISRVPLVYTKKVSCFYRYVYYVTFVVGPFFFVIPDDNHNEDSGVIEHIYTRISWIVSRYPISIMLCH